LQGGNDELVAALEKGDLSNAPLSQAERVLLEYVALLTRHSSRATRADVDRLLAAGWKTPQIAEAVYITALFAFFNRVADAFGLVDPQYRERFGENGRNLFQ
jgi:alkylhydroperoxidase family enzyme